MIDGEHSATNGLEVEITRRKMMRTSKYLNISFLICTSVVILLLVPLFMVNGGPDTYSAIAYPHEAVEHTLRNGRPVQTISFIIIWAVSNISYRLAFYYSLIMCVIFTIIAVYRYASFLQFVFSNYGRKTENGIVESILSSITIFNLFIVEYYLCPEVGPMWILAIWFCVEAAYLFVKFDRYNKPIFLLPSVMLVLISCFSYQVISAIFLIVLLPYIMTESICFKKFLRLQILSGLVYGIPMIINFIYSIEIANSERAQIGRVSSSDVINYAPSQESLSTYIFHRITLGMWFYAVACIVLSIFLLTKAIKCKEYAETIKGLYICFVIMIMGTLPYLMGVSNDFKPRLYYPIGYLFGILATYGYMKRYLTFDRSDLCEKHLYFVCFFTWMFIQLFSFVQISKERYETNCDDRILSEIYGDNIRKLENDYGIRICSVVFYHDRNKKKYISNQGWCMSLRGYGVEWGEIGVLNYYLDSSYSEGERDEELYNYFKTQDWDNYSDEQIIYKNGVCHICCY